MTTVLPPPSPAAGAPVCGGVPTSMPVYLLTRFGPAPLERATRSVPTPGPGDVLVRWRAWSLNYRDLVIADGSYLPDLPLPFVPVSDAAGEIAAVGAGVTNWRPGDRVVSVYVQTWDAGLPTAERIAGTLGGPRPGLLSAYSVLPENGVLPLPAHLSFAEGATLPIAAVTAWNVLFTHGDLRPGDSVVLEGTGAVSLFGLQLAHRAGLRTIVTSSSDEKLARARTLGAAETINYLRTPEWAQEVRRLTGGVGADLILDVGGAQTLPAALQAVRTGGRVALIGFLSGRTVALDAVALLRTLATLHGVRVGSREMFQDLLRFLRTNPDLKPVIDAAFPFAAARDAYEHARSGAAFGKVVILADPE